MKSEILTFRDRFDILLKMRLSGVVEQGYTIVIWEIPDNLTDQ